MVQPPGSDARVHAGTYKNTQAALCVYVPLRPQASEEHAHNPSKSPSDWVSPLEQYMTHLELKQHQRQVAAGSIRDPGRQVCICIFLWVYARSCLYMWCPTSWRRVCVVPHKLDTCVWCSTNWTCAKREVTTKWAVLMSVHVPSCTPEQMCMCVRVCVCVCVFVCVCVCVGGGVGRYMSLC